MEAVILAAGKGTRLMPHTDQTPKPLLLVQGRPILDWILAALPAKVERLVVVVNYLAEQVEDYLKTHSRLARWTTVRQEEARGTGDAFRSCQSTLTSDRILVLNGDDLYSAADLAALAAVPAGVLVKEVMNPERWGIALCRPDGTLERMAEKPKGLPPPQLGNIGAYVFPRSVFRFTLPLSPRGEYEITDYLSFLAAEQPVAVVRASAWFPIGTVEAWNQAQSVKLPL